MPAAALPTTDETALETRNLTIRVPLTLERRLRALAERDAVSISSTMKRLLSAGLRKEQEQDGRV